jgi:hypothetical protein
MDNLIIPTLSQEIKEIAHPDVQKIMDEIPIAIKHAERAVLLFDHCFDLHKLDSREQDFPQWFNQYVDAIFASSLSKYVTVNKGMIESANRYDFLSYALAGRSMIETTATIRYYLKKHIMPLVEASVRTGKISANESQTLLNHLHRLLVGTRFDWDSFLTEGFKTLTENYSDQVKRKNRGKNAGTWEANPLKYEQINAATCLQAWAKEDPKIGVLYDLFCDMVHPNFGSTLCVAIITENGVKFSPKTQESFGLRLFMMSYGPLQTLVGKEFANCISVIPSLKYTQDELDRLKP